jgi:transcriptional regulator with XRE-family HTH domain
MAKTTGSNADKYGNQRAPKNPPHFALKYARVIAGITAEELCRRIREEDPSLNPTRGTISAIESGTRGASPQMLAAICAAYGLPPDALVTDYQPLRRRPFRDVAAVEDDVA